MTIDDVKSRRIIWQGPGGRVKPTLCLFPVLDGEAEAAYFNRVAPLIQASNVDLAAYTRVAVVLASSLPASPSETWTWTGTTVITDAAKALRRNRSLPAIFADLDNLTAAQKTNVNADLFASSPAKWRSDVGPNAVSLWLLDAIVGLVTLSAADKNLLKLKAAAAYVQDNPRYLVNPIFDVSINVSGDEPIA